ncbi:LAETG motif-containing sortase-dependent surface protein [Streptomyces niveiscabiei]|uniref:LAETG motif-containing sortase-dependent surface protein n=1 Tax=Streptomyces niveiscabiei TaxID=164115 RepID=UPI0006EBB24C|nr:LAETG motif-containing sortase-dependent surface protein [Streptomyces niveiscabiei]
MKLRRAIAVAAATAALSPLVLMSAPSAFAEDGTSASPSPSVSASESAPEAAPSSPAADDTTGDDKGSASPSTSSSSTPSGSASGTPTGTPSASTSVSSTPSAPAEVDYCESEDEDAPFGVDENLTTGITGVPSAVVAGSGWKNITFKVSNIGDQTIKNIKPMVGIAAFTEEEDYSSKLTLQILQKSTGTWKTLADASDEGATLSAINLAGGQSVSYKLRFSVDVSVPRSFGITGGIAMYSDSEGCWISDDPNLMTYRFQVLAAGSKPGKPGNAKPQTGGAKPVNLNDVEVTGSLAETGSSSALPMIGLVGGAAVVAGAGAIFIVRRRKADGSHA